MLLLNELMSKKKYFYWLTCHATLVMAFFRLIFDDIENINTISLYAL